MKVNKITRERNMLRLLLIISSVILLGCKEKVDLSKFNLNDISDVALAMAEMNETEREELFSSLQGKEYSFNSRIVEEGFGLFGSYKGDGYKKIDLDHKIIHCVIEEKHKAHILRYFEKGDFNCNGTLARFKEGNFGHYFLYILYQPTDEQNSFVNSLPLPSKFTDKDANAVNTQLSAMTDIGRDKFWEGNENLPVYLTDDVKDVVGIDLIVGDKTGSVRFSNTNISCHIGHMYLFIIEKLKKGDTFTCTGNASTGLFGNNISYISFDPVLGVK
jgi:hypothetical protein